VFGNCVIARNVGSRATAPRMVLTIDLDAQARFKAGKIKRVGAERVLAPELVTAGPLAELAPQDHLGEIARSALVAGQTDGLRRCAKG
jgi:hypothetical protein